MTSTARQSAIFGAVLLAASLLAAPALAQVYRIVGPDGKVTFSDKPPVEPTAGKVSNAAGGTGASSGGALPFELRQIANKYPVTLYTGDNCAPCGTARALLGGRGVPFTEKTVKTDKDIQALQRLSGETSLPFATIGSQQLKGFSDSEWIQFLDAAGYPKTSALPANYRQVPATPLVAVVAPPAAPAAPAADAAAPRPTAAPAPSGSNPAGIKF